MKNLTFVFLILLSGNLASASQLESYLFDNSYELRIQPNGDVEKVVMTNDEDGDFSLTLNCTADKKEMIIERFASPGDLFGTKSFVARVDYDSLKNCLSTSGLIDRTVGSLQGVIKVRVNPDSHKIVDAEIYGSTAKMLFKD